MSSDRPATLPPLLLTCAALAACQPPPDTPAQAQRLSLEAARHVPAAPLASPDTADAAWTVSADGQAIRFARPAGPPLLTLACRLRETPPLLEIIRHAPALPGQQALFPVIGNGTISRFKLDARLAQGEWRWQGAVPAGDPQLDVFTGPNELEATLPGAGSLLIGGSRIPGEFVHWCRAGSRVQRAEAREQAAARPGATPAAPAR